jgi:DNA-binding GntR family transcriptional regulator
MKKNPPLYLLATYVQRPMHSHLTSRKNYGKRPDAWQNDEQVAFAKRLRKSDIQTCNVIMDLANKELLKCQVGELTGSDYARVYAYFNENYAEHMAQAELQIRGEPLTEKIADVAGSDEEAQALIEKHSYAESC